MIFCVLQWTWSFVFIFVFVLVCIYVLCFCAATDFSVNKDLYHNYNNTNNVRETSYTGPILSVFPALIVHSELKSVHPGFPVAFIF